VRVRVKIVVLLVTAAMTVAPASAQRRWPNRGHEPVQRENTPPPNAPFGHPDSHGNSANSGSSRNAPLQNRGARSGPRMGDWLRKHATLPPREQERDLENDPAFRSLPAQQQDRLRDRLQKFNSLPPDRRQRILQRMDAWDRMTPDQRDRARDLFQRFRSVPEDRRKAMGFALRNLRNMSPEQRRNVMASPQFRSSFSDDERNIIRGMTDLNIGHTDDGNTPDGP